MAINVQIQDRSARVTMSGHFDFQVRRNFKDSYVPLLNNTTVREIEFEMSKVDYLDSSALGMLLLLHERTKAVNKKVALLNTSGVVLQILESANFRKIFNIEYSALSNTENRENSYEPENRNYTFWPEVCPAD